MRTRSRSVPSVTNPSATLKYRNLYHQQIGGTKPGSMSGLVTALSLPDIGDSSSESITDEGGSYVPGRVNSCSHTKESTKYEKLSVQPSTLTLLSGGQPYYSYVYEEGSFVPYIVPALSHLTLPSTSSEEASFVDSAVRQSVEVIPTSVSVANFLLELDDLPRTLQHLRRLRSFGFSSLKSLRRYMLKRGAVRGTSKVAADNYLAYQFGIRPIVQDLAGFFSSHEAIRKRVAFLKKTYRKEVSFKRAIGFSHSVTGPWSLNYNLSTTHRLTVDWYSKTNRKVVCMVGGKVYNTLGGLDDPMRIVLAHLAAYGFNKPLNIAWSAIPFSFLVDYVSNLSEILNSFQTEVFTGELTLRNPWFSRKSTTVTEVIQRVNYTQGSNALRSPTSTMGRTQIRKTVSYSRQKGFPTSQGLKFADLSEISLTQWTNVAALLA